MKYCLLLLSLVLNFTEVKNVYFLFTKGITKCFYEEFYKDNIITLEYSTLEDFHEMEMQEHEHEPNFFITLTNLNTEKEDEYQGINPTGKIKFIITESSSYSICITPREDAKLFENHEVLKISVTLETIEENSTDKDLSALPKNEDFNKINTKVDKLHKKIIDIIKTQHYQINREDEFIEQQVFNSNIIIYLTAVQVVILIVLTVWQVYSIKDLFKDHLANIL